MLGMNNWSEKLRERLTAYADERFEDYKGRLSTDLSQGIATLASLLTIWTIAMVCLIFIGIMLGMFLTQILSFWVGNWSGVLGFLIITILYIIIGSWFLKNRVKFVENPVYKAVYDALNQQKEGEEEIKQNNFSAEEKEERIVEPLENKFDKN